jgi:pimeloyl-ACP methyl ester carboxylesterase
MPAETENRIDQLRLPRHHSVDVAAAASEPLRSREVGRIIVDVAGWRVVLLPGSVLPASIAYTALLPELGPDVDARLKELEVYAESSPPAYYTLDHEIDAVLRLVTELGWDRFHLVGYSGGGAASLAFAAKHPHRLLSLALLEPAWAGNWDDCSAAHRELWATYDEIESLPPERFMAEFRRLGVRSDVVLPPSPAGDPPPWLALRPAGIRAFLRTFRTYDLDRSALQGFDRPVYFALGGLSNPDEYAEAATRLAKAFPDFELEVFENRHHFDPPHRVEPARLAGSLRRLWQRAQPD